MQYEIISSEITGEVPVHNHPGTDKKLSRPICEIRNKEGRQEMRILRRHAEQLEW
jgi:hypothetical protein